MNSLILLTSALCFMTPAPAAVAADAISNPSATESHFTLSESTITPAAEHEIDSDSHHTPIGSSGYELTWYTIDGGGGTSVAAGFSLSGTIGQSDAGTMSGGGFELAGGFWTGGGAEPQPTCPGDLNNDNAIDVSDLLILLGAWGPCGGGSCQADLNSDNTVDVADMLVLLGAWGLCS